MIFLECLKSVGKILHGDNYLWSMMKKSSVSRMQRLLYSQILCYVLETWIRTQHQILFGKKIELVQEFIRIQNFGHNWRRADGIRMEYFPKIHHIAIRRQKSKSSWTKWATQHNSKDELSSCRCSTTWHGELQRMKRNVLPTPHVCLHLQKDVQQDVGHYSNGILVTTKDHQENGTKSLNSWWSKLEKADTQFSEPRILCLEERSKAKEVENYQYTSVPMWIRFLIVFRTIISVNQPSIYGAVSDLCEEYGSCQTRTERPVLAGQFDPWFEPANLLITTPAISSEITAKPVLVFKSIQNCLSMPMKTEEEDQTRTVRPVGGKETTKVPRWRSTTLTSEYQDCHMQLWKKQNISEFKSLWKRSEVIFVEKQFMPICSRITSTTH